MSGTNNPRVLLACPINIVKDYCMDQWIDMIKNLTYDNYDIYLVDNSKNPQYHKDLKKRHNVKISYVKPERNEEARYYMARSIEKIRKRAVSKGYDRLFILEVDVFPPANVIERLLVHDKQVVGATYFTGHGQKTFLQLLKAVHLGEGKFEASFYGWSEAAAFMNGKLNRAFANGNGCILIKREVLQQIKFHVDPDQVGHADSFFHSDIFKLGIDNWIDTSFIPVHLNSDWDTMPDDIEHADLWRKLQTKTFE